MASARALAPLTLIAMWILPERTYGRSAGAFRSKFHTAPRERSLSWRIFFFHHQTGVAPNEIELHPILAFRYLTRPSVPAKGHGGLPSVISLADLRLSRSRPSSRRCYECAAALCASPRLGMAEEQVVAPCGQASEPPRSPLGRCDRVRRPSLQLVFAVSAAGGAEG